MLYGSGKRITHRMLFVIREQRIVVNQIRHVAMGNLTAEDLLQNPGMDSVELNAKSRLTAWILQVFADACVADMA
jgi:hypothetical protein